MGNQYSWEDALIWEEKRRTARIKAKIAIYQHAPLADLKVLQEENWEDIKADTESRVVRSETGNCWCPGANEEHYAIAKALEFLIAQKQKENKKEKQKR